MQADRPHAGPGRYRRLAASLTSGVAPGVVHGILAQEILTSLRADRAWVAEGASPDALTVVGAAPRGAGPGGLPERVVAEAVSTGFPQVQEGGGEWHAAARVEAEAAHWGILAASGTGAAPEGAGRTLADISDVAAIVAATLTVRELAVTDPLTGIANRRAADAAVRAEVARAHRYGRALSLALIDLDGFKQVNDRYGHQAGDRALQVVAHTLATHTRTGEMVARMGGDELAWLLPETEAGPAAAAVERACAAISAATAGPVQRLSVSVGIAEVQPGASAASLVAAADEALRMAKAAGKGRVVVLGADRTPLPPGNRLAPLPVRYLRAALDTDELRMRGILEEAATRGLVELYDHLLVPVMAEVGHRWQEGLLSVGEEHLVSSMSERLVAERAGRGERDAPLALLACAPGNNHRLGVMAAGDVIAHAGWRPVIMGAVTPNDALVEIARRLGAAMVGLSCGTDADLETVEGQVAALAVELPGVAVVVGGNAVVRAAAWEPPPPARAVRSAAETLRIMQALMPRPLAAETDGHG